MTHKKSLQQFLKDVIKNDIFYSYRFREKHSHNEYLSGRALNFFGISWPICFCWGILCGMYVGITDGKSSFMSFSFFLISCIAIILINSFILSNLKYFKILIQTTLARLKIWKFERNLFKNEETFPYIMNFLEFNSLHYEDKKTISSDMMRQTLSVRAITILNYKTLQVQEKVMMTKLLNASDPNNEQNLDELQKKALFSFE